MKKYQGAKEIHLKGLITYRRLTDIEIKELGLTTVEQTHGMDIIYESDNQTNAVISSSYIGLYERIEYKRYLMVFKRFMVKNILVRFIANIPKNTHVVAVEYYTPSTVARTIMNEMFDYAGTITGEKIVEQVLNHE